MAYSGDIAKLLTDQLARFVTLNRHQLAGHVANLDFWLAEVRHCLGVLDGYRQRFDRLKAAETIPPPVYRHKPRVPVDEEDTPAELVYSARPATRVSDGELKAARRSLCDATYYFLIQCFREGLLDESAVRQACAKHDIGIEPSDLQSARR